MNRRVLVWMGVFALLLTACHRIPAVVYYKAHIEWTQEGGPAQSFEETVAVAKPWGIYADADTDAVIEVYFPKGARGQARSADQLPVRFKTPTAWAVEHRTEAVKGKPFETVGEFTRQGEEITGQYTLRRLWESGDKQIVRTVRFRGTKVDRDMFENR